VIWRRCNVYTAASTLQSFPGISVVTILARRLGGLMKRSGRRTAATSYRTN
jgi:hypothetical protein